MSSISVTTVKACQVSDDGTELILTLATRYVGDMKIVMPIACREQALAALTQVAAGKSGGEAATKSVTVKVPKKWIVTADAERHGVVLLIFDHQTPSQSAYALQPEAAKQFAVGITKSAESLLARKPDGPAGA